MAITDRNQTQQVVTPEDPLQDPDLLAPISAAETPGGVDISTFGRMVPRSFVEYSADPVNVEKIPQRVPAGTPLPSVAAKMITSASTNAPATLFTPSPLDAHAASLEDSLMSTTPTPSLTDPTGRTFGQPPSSGYTPAPTPSQPGQGGPPTPLSYDDIKKKILAEHPVRLPGQPPVLGGTKKSFLGMALATLADDIGASLRGGQGTVGKDWLNSIEANNEYNRNYPVMRQNAENQAVDEGLRQMDTAAQVNERMSAAWKAAHPNVPPPKVNFTAGGIPFSISHGQNEYTIGDPNMPQYLQPIVNGAIAAHQQRIQEQTAQKTGPAFPPATLDNLNKTLTDRWQVLNPGKPLPAQYTLASGATQGDYERTDKALEAVERATGTKAQQDTANALRQQAANLAKQNAQDRADKQSSIPIIGFDKNGHQVFTNMGNSNAAGLTEVRQVGQAEAEKVTNARGLIPVFDSKDPSDPGILQLVDKLDKEGKLGPMASRWNDFLDGKYGSGDPDFEALRTKMGLAQTGLMQVHVGARGNAFLLEHFQDMVNEKKMDAGTLKAGLNTELGYIKGKAMLPNGGAAVAPAAPQGMITVQIPGQPPGHIPASARKQFLQDNPGAQVIE